jgi:hypothetical protein
VAVVVNEVTGNRLPGRHLGSRPPGNGWGEMQRLVLAQASALTGPMPGIPGLCAVCRGPAGTGRVRCFQCDLQRQCAGSELADLVVPIAFATKGDPHASRLWQYKSIPDSSIRQLTASAGAAADGGRWDAVWSAAVAASDSDAGLAGPVLAAGSGGNVAGRVMTAVGGGDVEERAARAVEAGRLLRALLLVFLRDHGRCGWREARITWPPTHLAVVPSARGRAGVHPLRALIAPYLSCRWAELSAKPDYHQLRDLDPDRFVAEPVPGGRILLLDDTWTTGTSAQSAAMALRRAGARSIATVVLGRHINPEFVPIRTTGLEPPHAFSLKMLSFRSESCAVHRDEASADVVGG